MTSLKERIGERITTSRKELGITIKELAERTKELSAARINNWELGSRSPGPKEAQLLAGVLGVSPAYLLCLSNSPKGDLHLQTEILPQYVPLIRLNETNLSKEQLNERIQTLSPYLDDQSKIPLHGKTKSMAGPYTFATTIEDSSMSPDFKPGDVIIADPDRNPKPGHYVIAHIQNTNEILVRKYRETNLTPAKTVSIELLSLNPDWATTILTNPNEGHIIATVLAHHRCFGEGAK